MDVTNPSGPIDLQSQLQSQLQSRLAQLGEPGQFAQVAAHFDGLDAAGRLAAIRALSGRQQAALFEAAQGARRLTVEDMVPAGLAPLQEVVHNGKNSLPLFTHFAKVFCRPDDGNPAELWGYNRTRPIVSGPVGPGYFVAYAHGDGELLIDYLRVPPRKPQAWPPILQNSARLSRFVYYKTQDILRGVSRHVSIGRATREGRPMDNWFVLCREG